MGQLCVVEALDVQRDAVGVKPGPLELGVEADKGASLEDGCQRLDPAVEAVKVDDDALAGLALAPVPELQQSDPAVLRSQGRRLDVEADRRLGGVVRLLI